MFQHYHHMKTLDRFCLSQTVDFIVTWFLIPYISSISQVEQIIVISHQDIRRHREKYHHPLGLSEVPGKMGDELVEYISI